MGEFLSICQFKRIVLAPKLYFAIGKSKAPMRVFGAQKFMLMLGEIDDENKPVVSEQTLGFGDNGKRVIKIVQDL
ncbi:MAG: hypothetical protein KAG66_24200, partial [Methylococcales bacterium]|nr:hypothetical protein [Methylococcales bacterium]